MTGDDHGGGDDHRGGDDRPGSDDHPVAAQTEPEHPLRPQVGRRAAAGAALLALVGLGALVGGTVALLAGGTGSSRAGLALGLGLVLLGAASARLGRAAGHGRRAESARHRAEPLLSATGRRNMLLAGGLAALAALVAPVAAFGRGAERDRRRTDWEAGDRLVTRDGQPVTTTTLREGSVTTCWPEGSVGAADASVVLVRVRPDSLRPEPGREDWSPEGLVAYSKLCTHMGCPVGLLQSDPGVLICPCHQSIFDITEGGRALRGPAPRPLPQLPLEVDGEGGVRARGDFPEPVGPGWWSRPS